MQRNEASISGQATGQPGPSGEGKRKEREEAEARREKGKEGVALFLAGRRKKGEIECRHLALGKCIAGTRCGFMHVSAAMACVTALQTPHGSPSSALTPDVSLAGARQRPIASSRRAPSANVEPDTPRW